MNRIITTLGHTNKKLLRAYFDKTFGFTTRNINQITKFLGAETNNETYEYLQDEYNQEVEEKQKTIKKVRYQEAKTRKSSSKNLDTIIKSNESYFQKKFTAIKNRKSSIISKFFQSYKKPINMEKRMKYKNDNETV